MAIDSTIALGGKQFAGADGGGKTLSDYAMDSVKIAQMGQSMLASKQQIEASKSQQALTEAQIPGVRAESEIKVRASDFNKWKTANASNYTNDDGSLNIAGFIGHANRAGYATEAQAVATSDLSNKSAAITNATNEQNRLVAAANFTSTATNHVATLLDNPKISQSTKDAQLRVYVDKLNKAVPGSGDQVLQLLGKPTADGKSWTINPEAITASATATMTKQQQTDNLINKQNADTSSFNAATSAESVKQSGVANVSSPEARDPNSQVSKLAVQKAIDAGIAGITPGITSAADLEHLTGVKGQVEAANIPGQTKAAAATAEVTSRQEGKVYNNAADIVDKLVASGKMPKGTPIGAWISANAGRLANDPDYRALQAALTSVTAANPAINATTIDGPSLSGQLRNQSKLANEKGATAGVIARSSTFNQLPGGQPAGAPAAAAGVNMINKSGHRITIPADMVDKATKSGYVKETK